MATRKIEMLYQPRSGQARLHTLLRRFSVLVCHRRWGKTYFAINQLIGSGLKAKRVNTAARPHFLYIAPLRHQAKSIAWDVLKHYSRPYVLKPDDINEAELRVDLLGGSRIQLFGADNPDAARGIGANGAVFDEYGDMDPTMRSQVIGPALSDRQGFELFIGTPKGANAFQDIFEQARERAAAGDEQWFATMIKASESGVLPVDELELQRTKMSDEEYAQEYECSFAAPMSGSIYGKTLASASSRVMAVPWEPGLPVYTAWDLGKGDATAIWLFQIVGREIHVIDYLEDSLEELAFYVGELNKRPYMYASHGLPHDVEHKLLGMPTTRLQQLRALGLGQVRVLKQQSVADGIAAVRQLFPRLYFDAVKCATGLRALRQYRYQWDDKRKVFSKEPLHDWASNGSDAMRYLAQLLPLLGDKTATQLMQGSSTIPRPKLGIV